jgi:putative addiction module killer protein
VEAQEREIRVYVTRDGKRPFEEWIKSLRDKRARARIFARIDRLRLGNFGDCRSVGGGIYELRAHYGPGYRVYFALLGTTVVLLLTGGTKKGQRRDIKRAQEYWKEYKDHAQHEL